MWDQLWESRDDSPYDLTFDQNGALVIGTGNKGKMYRLEGDPLRPTLLARASAQQVTAFHKDARGRLYYATANPGKVFRLTSERATRGTYESEPRDAQMVATWGTLSWRGTASDGNRIELFTRSGNTETPDETWSAWSAAYTNADGSPITSPKTRYLQWRAVLTGKGDGPVLTSVTAAYLQRNLRPQVRSVTVHPPGIVFQKPYTTGEPDLAGFEDQTTPERKLAQAAALQGARTAWAVAPIRRGSRRCSGAPTTKTTTSSSMTCCSGARARPRGRCSAAPSPTTFSCGTPTRCRTARTSSRSWRRTGRRIQRAPR